MRFVDTRRMSASAVAVAVALVAPAAAQESQTAPSPDALDEIVVTAQRRAENIQDVPVSITALGGEALADRGLASVEELENVVPGLQISQSAGVTLPFLRGVGNPGTTIGNESSVAVYVDGVYFSRLPSGVFALNNVSRVEVLKGPQGTLFGRNASGGVLHVITLDPSHDTSIKGGLGYGRFDTIEGNLYATTGLSNTVAADISISGRYQGEGYGEFVNTGNRVNYQDSFVARSKVLFEPVDGTRVTLSGLYSYSKNNLAGNTYPGTIAGFSSAPFAPITPVGFYDQYADTESRIKADTWGGALKVEQDLSFARLTSTTAYLNTETDQLADVDFTSRPDGVATPHGLVKQFTQELQLSSLSGSPLKWTAGLFYFDTVSEYDEETRFISPSGALASLGGTAGFTALGRQHVKSYAVYGQATYEILPRLEFTGGLRYTWDRIDADGALVRPNGTFLSNPPAGESNVDKPSFRAALDYRLTDDVLGYVSYSRGFKSAVFNLLTYNSTPNKPEQVDAYEIGFKSELFDRRVRLNAAAFYYDLKDPQVQLTRAPSIIFSNAEASRIKGIEADLQIRVASPLTLRAGATYLESKYRRYGRIDPATGACTDCAPSGPQNPNAPYGAVSPLIGIVANGNYTPFAPKLTANIGFDYELPLGSDELQISADYLYNDGFFTEPDNFLRQKSFNIVNAQIKYSFGEQFAVRLWGKNLLDEKYVERLNTNAGPPGYTFTPAAPLTFGMAFDFSF